MYKHCIKKLTISLLVIANLSSLLVCSYAATKDIDQEIMIKSNRQAGDLKNKIISYLDDVSITQGSLSITADLVQVIKQSHNNVEVDIYVAKGQPATFEQLLDDGTPVKLQANEIRYEPARHTITIIGNAVLSQEGSEVRGSKITYNTLTEQLQAESNNDESVTTILKPKAKVEK